MQLPLLWRAPLAAIESGAQYVAYRAIRARYAPAAGMAAGRRAILFFLAMMATTLLVNVYTAMSKRRSARGRTAAAAAAAGDAGGEGADMDMGMAVGGTAQGGSALARAGAGGDDAAAAHGVPDKDKRV